MFTLCSLTRELGPPPSLSLLSHINVMGIPRTQASVTSDLASFFDFVDQLFIVLFL